MNDGNIRVVKLACVSCAAILDISTGMERLACGFCGTSQTVERTGGTISLKMVAAVLQQVQQGTDRTAAELAIARLTKELRDCREYIFRNEKEVDQKANSKRFSMEQAIRDEVKAELPKPPEVDAVIRASDRFQYSNARYMLPINLVPVIYVLAVLGILAYQCIGYSDSKQFEGFPWILRFAVLFVVFSVLTPIAQSFWEKDGSLWRSLPEPPPDPRMMEIRKKYFIDLERTCDERIAQAKPEIDAAVAEIEKELVDAKARLITLESQLAKAKEIVES